MGLEPTTVGLKVQRSTDWANRALFENKSVGFVNDSSFICESLLVIILEKTWIYLYVEYNVNKESQMHEPG